MQLVLNDASFNCLGKYGKNEGQIGIEKFVKAFSAAVKSKYNFNSSIVTFVSLNDLMIAKDYYIAQWRNEIGDRDLLRRFMFICDKQTLIDTTEDDIELSYQGVSSNGLLYAHINQDIPISLTVDHKWKEEFIKGTVYNLADDSTNIVEIFNFSDMDQLDICAPIFDTIHKGEIADIIDCSMLIDRLSLIFPFLCFTEVSIRQLRCDVQLQHLNAIKKRLYDINTYFSTWDCGNIDLSLFASKVTPESVQTLQDFKRQHEFEINGKTVLASYHSRYTGNIPGRVYFCPDKDTGKAIICSLTTKLPSVSYPKCKI